MKNSEELTTNTTDLESITIQEIYLKQVIINQKVYFIKNKLDEIYDNLTKPSSITLDEEKGLDDKKDLGLIKNLFQSQIETEENINYIHIALLNLQNKIINKIK